MGHHEDRATGIGLGFISYVLIKLLNKKASEIHWLMYLVSVLFVIAFVLPSIQAAIG